MRLARLCHHHPEQPGAYTCKCAAHGLFGNCLRESNGTPSTVATMSVTTWMKDLEYRDGGDCLFFLVQEHGLTRLD
jgi:hypothetical protein